jgi:type IV secretion system protein TrbJ
MQTPLRRTPILAVMLATSTAAPAAGTGTIAGATLPEQIIQEATAANQYVKEAAQLQQQIQAVMNQVKNLQSLPTQLWPNISSQITQLINLAGNAQGLTYASMNTASQVQAEFGSPSAPLSNYSQTLQRWTANLNSQIANVLLQYGVEANHFATEQSALQVVQNASLSATGRMQVLQAGNQISGMIMNQLQLLRGDIMSGNQVLSNALANKANQEQQDRNNGDRWIKSDPTYHTTL